MESARVFGVDFGSQRCVVAAESGDVVLNELGAMTTATLVAFKGDERLLGEAAVLSASTNPANTVDFLNLLLGKDLDGVKAELQRLPGQRVAFGSDASGRVVASVDYREGSQFTIEQLTAMLLAKLHVQIKTRVLQTEGDSAANAHAIIAVPSAWGASEKNALRLAAKIAGLGHVSIIPRDAALARCFHRKHPIHQKEGEPEETRHIMIVDMGHTSTSAAVVKLTANGETVLSSEADVSIGAETLDRRMFEHFKQELRASQNLEIEFQTKEGKRLFQACEKLKKLLSTIGEASVTVENVAQDRDAKISLSRDAFERLCTAERSRVVEMVRSAIANANVPADSIASVEIVGGGTRVPFVQSSILEALSATDSSLIGRMLDSTTAIAVGAAYSRDLIEAAEEKGEASEEIDQWIALESEMQARDADLAAIAHERNAIESFVYEMRSKRHDAHGELIDGSKLDPLLEAAEDWIYSEESEFATLEQVRAKRSEIESQVKEACAAYFSAVSEAQRVFEAQLEEESEKAKAEQGEGDDHDTRKLKKPERMRLVVKNKEEGNELFRDGNYQHAALRYVKALTHASKFFDLSSDDLEEVHALKLSLHLNLAQCYIKLESWSKAIANCNDAIALDHKSVKALYRRAVAYEKEKNLEKAQEDIKLALSLAPNDKAVQKLDERLRLLAKRQLDKEKKMWSKAFA